LSSMCFLILLGLKDLLRDGWAISTLQCLQRTFGSFDACSIHSWNSSQYHLRSLSPLKYQGKHLKFVLSLT
jgi:hypothetical protein